MYGTDSIDFNSTERANVNFALVQYVNMDSTAFSTRIPLKSTSYKSSEVPNFKKGKQKKLSSLSGLFNFDRLDKEYFREKEA